MTQERIGFTTPARKDDENKRLTQEVEMLKRRVELSKTTKGTISNTSNSKNDSRTLEIPHPLQQMQSEADI